ENVDALLIFAGAVGNRCGLPRLAEFCSQFGRIPMCTVAGSFPGVPSISVSNYAGMRDAIMHLIGTHNRRKIAFVRGPEANSDAEERYRAYLDALRSSDIEFDPNLVAPGDFSVQAGAEAVRLFFDERAIPVSGIDALVAADD